MKTFINNLKRVTFTFLKLSDFWPVIKKCLKLFCDTFIIYVFLQEIFIRKWAPKPQNLKKKVEKISIFIPSRHATSRDIQGTFRGLLGDQKKNDNLMKKVLFRFNGYCSTHLLLFFTAKTNMQKF